METLVRAVGVLCCLLIGMGVLSSVAQLFAPKDEREAQGELRGLKMPALAMEFVEDAGEVEAFLGARDAEGDSPMRRKLRRALAWDNLFIASYWLLFAGLCAILSQRAWPGFALWLAVFAALCATGAAISDTVENARTLVLLDAAQVTGPLLRSVAAASFEKWLLIALATLALSPVFLWAGGRAATLAGSALFALYVVVGLLTLWGNLGARPRLVAAGFLLNFVGVIAVAVLFTAWPRWVAERL